MSLIKKTFDFSGLDTPLEFEPKGYFKKNKIRVILINEDLSFREWWLKFPDSYVFSIKKKFYFFIPECVIKGKYPLIVYYFNNPCPIKWVFKKSEVTALMLRSPEQLSKLEEKEKVILANIFMDAETINLAFTTRVMRGLYAKTGLNAKVFIIIAIILFIMTLIILQVTGTVDILGALQGKKRF
jgi:hypothetical protein